MVKANHSIDCELLADLIYKTTKRYPNHNGSLNYLAVGIAIELEAKNIYRRDRFVRLCGVSDFVSDDD